MASHERRPTRRVDQDLRAIGALTQAVLDGIDVEQLLGQIAAEARTLVGAALGLVSLADATASLPMAAIVLWPPGPRTLRSSSSRSCRGARAPAPPRATREVGTTTVVA